MWKLFLDDDSTGQLVQLKFYIGDSVNGHATYFSCSLAETKQKQHAAFTKLKVMAPIFKPIYLFSRISAALSSNGIHFRENRNNYRNSLLMHVTFDCLRIKKRFVFAMTHLVLVP